MTQEIKSENKSNSNQKQTQKSKQNTILIIWDFDWSLINENSDYYPLDIIAGSKDKSRVIYNELNDDAQINGITQFTDFQDTYMWPYIFKTCNINADKLYNILTKIPIYKENLKIINKLHEDSTYNIIQYVVSDANTFLIESVLKHHKILDNIILKKNIYTNPGYIDKKTGILRVKRYVNKNNPHNCKNKCSLNMCKGDILNKEILTQYNKNDILKLIYIGDGSGDFCPITYFTKNDYVFVRKYSKLRGLERKIVNTKLKLKVNVLKWKNGSELLKCFKTALNDIQF